MLTPEQLQNLPVGISRQYTDLSDYILRDICRRIAEAGKITDTAEYQIYRAKALALSNKEIRNKIAEINGISEKEVNKLFRDVAKTSDEFDRKVFKQPEDAGTPLSENKVLQQVISAQSAQTNETFENITGTMGFAEKRDGQVVYSSLTDTLRKEMDAAHLKITSGATDYITAIRAATKKLSDSGVRTIYYESGRSDRVDVAVRRAILTGTSQVVQKISEQNGEQFGADGWEISAHSGARPSHAIYQGRQYPQKDYDRIVRPLIEDYNCRHSAYPIVLGVSVPTYTAEQLKHIDPPPFTYDGKTYTAYEATQQQRKMERAMRRQKDLCVASDAAGDKDGFTTAAIKLRRQNEIYKDFSEKAGLYTQYERTQVQGFNRSISSKATWAVRKATEMERNQLTLTESPDSATIRGKASAERNTITSPEKWKQKVKSVGYVDINDTEAVNNLLSNFEKKYSSAGRERCLVIAKDGNVYMVRGDDYYVDTTILLGDKMKNSINIHNHPPKTTQYSFSKEDVISFVEDGSLEMIASDEKYQYKITSSTNVTDIEKTKEAYYNSDNRKYELFDNANLSYSDYAENIQHLVIDDVCKSLGLKYERIIK